MAKVGDTVRYLNEVGGGVITRIEGKLAYVDDNGFETPVLLKDLVVVVPAGEASRPTGTRLMFDQQAYDKGKSSTQSKEIKRETQSLNELPPIETEYGDSMNLVLAFEPTNVKNLSISTFNAVLVNDSNYFLKFMFLCSADNKHWKVIYEGTAAPNELTDIAQFNHSSLPEIERVAIQALAYKNNKEFALKKPISFEKRLDLTKFHKYHCFRPGEYFDSPVLELPILKKDNIISPIEISPNDLEKAMLEKLSIDHPIKKKRINEELNPHKLLPVIEVDLHIGELTDSIAGMKSSDMLSLQLDVVRRTMNDHSKRLGQKIVFIHGKGEGVLRNAVVGLLKKEFPKSTLQDASFREYGFGATLVTIH